MVFVLVRGDTGLEEEAEVQTSNFRKDRHRPGPGNSDYPAVYTEANCCLRFEPQRMADIERVR